MKNDIYICFFDNLRMFRLFIEIKKHKYGREKRNESYFNFFSLLFFHFIMERFLF